MKPIPPPDDMPPEQKVIWDAVFAVAVSMVYSLDSVARSLRNLEVLAQRHEAMLQLADHELLSKYDLDPEQLDKDFPLEPHTKE